MGGVHMSCFGSKHELLQVADHVIAHYYQRVPFVRNHPQAIDLDMLVMELMGGSIKMFPLSKDGSMLGMTAHERLIIRMELEDGTIICDTLRPKDIVIDSSLAGFTTPECGTLLWHTKSGISFCTFIIHFWLFQTSWKKTVRTLLQKVFCCQSAL